MRIRSNKQESEEKRFHIEGLGEVDLNASVWDDLQAQTLREKVMKLRVGQREQVRFQGSFNLGLAWVRRVQ